MPFHRPATVLVAPTRDVGAFVWFTLGRPNYLALDQSAGVVYSRETALEVQSRSEMLLPLMDPTWKILTSLQAQAGSGRKSEAGIRPLTPEKSDPSLRGPPAWIRHCAENRWDSIPCVTSMPELGMTGTSMTAARYDRRSRPHEDGRSGSNQVWRRLCVRVHRSTSQSCSSWSTISPGGMLPPRPRLFWSVCCSAMCCRSLWCSSIAGSETRASSLQASRLSA